MASVGGGGSSSRPRKIDNGPVPAPRPKLTVKAVAVPGKVTRRAVPKTINRAAPVKNTPKSPAPKQVAAKQAAANQYDVSRLGYGQPSTKRAR